MNEGQNEFEKNRTIFREMIVNEELLIHRRLTWLFQIQIPIIVALVGGIFMLIDKDIALNENQILLLKKGLAIVSFLGFVFSVLIYSALFAATKAMSDIKTKWHEISQELKEKYKGQIHDGQDIFGLHPDNSIMPYFSSENMIALTFVFMWLAISIFISVYVTIGFLVSDAILVFLIILFWLYIFIFKKNK